MHRILLSVIAAGLLLPLMQASQIPASEKSNVVLPQDKGPDKLDVSRYPPEIRKAYPLFADKCSQCHTLARGINTTMPRDAWERYVKRMMHKPKSGIDPVQGKTIFDFLVYDQKVRKDPNPSAFYPSLTDEQIEALKAQQHVR